MHVSQGRARLHFALRIQSDTSDEDDVVKPLLPSGATYLRARQGRHDTGGRFRFSPFEDAPAMMMVIFRGLHRKGEKPLTEQASYTSYFNSIKHTTLKDSKDRSGDIISGSHYPRPPRISGRRAGASLAF